MYNEDELCRREFSQSVNTKIEKNNNNKKKRNSSIFLNRLDYNDVSMEKNKLYF